MVDTSKIIKSLGEIEAELRRSGKEETADFFKKAADLIDEENDQEKLKERISELKNSGAITQYANFSHSEDMLFENVYLEAKKLLEVM